MDWQIKLQFSADVSYITISNFCEKQVVLNDTTFIFKNHFSDQQKQMTFEGNEAQSKFPP